MGHASVTRPIQKYARALLLASVCVILVVVFWLRTTNLSAGASSSANAALQPARWSNDELTVANLGHATLLINLFGVRVISDPTLFYRVGASFGPLFTIGPHRFSPAPLSPAQLQSIDLILITHAHMDHLDIPSLKVLPKTAVVIACTGCGDLIRPLGFRDVRELEWGQHTVVNGLDVAAMGARHWGKRWPPWGRTYGFNSYVLTKNGHRMLLACDSAYTDLFATLHDKPLDVAAFSSAAYDPWIWNHANPEEVWSMFRQTGAHYLIPIHWGTFRLSKEPMDEPMRRLSAAAGREGSEIAIRTIGVAWRMPQTRTNTVQALEEKGATPASRPALAPARTRIEPIVNNREAQRHFVSRLR